MVYSLLHKDLRSLFHTRFSLFLSLIISFCPFQAHAADSTYKTKADEFRVKGYEEQIKGNFDKALSYYTQALTLGGDSAILNNDLGVVYEQYGLSERAEYYYLRAVEADPQYCAPYTNLAYLYKNRGDRQKALTYFEKRLKCPSADDSWRPKIEAEINALDPERRQRILRQEARELEKKLVEQSREAFQTDLMRARQHVARAESFQTAGNFDKALEEYEQALNLTPENPHILEAMAYVRYLKTMDQVKKKVQRALTRIDEGELKEAKDEFLDVLTILPNQAVPPPGQ